MLSEELTERQQQILRIVVQEYIHTAKPIGSKRIADHPTISVSAATVRNDLAALEKLGLLTHPHTSAGRIPTDSGYRYFVRHLLSHAELPLAERVFIQHQFRNARLELDQWLRLSTSVLSRVAQSAALATAPRAPQSRFKHVELVATHGTKVLLVLVLQAGTVKQQLLDLDQPIEQDTLSQVSNELNDHLIGKDVIEISQSYSSLSPFAQQVALLLTDLMDRTDNRLGRHIYRDGLAQILEAPEFAEGENVRSIVQVLEERSLLEQVVEEYGQASDIQVVIAGDGRFAKLQEFSLVLSRYGVANQVTGVLGVVGPVRMSYGRTIGAVRFISDLMSDMVEDIYGL